MMVTSFLFVCSNKAYGKRCASARWNQKELETQWVTGVHSNSCELLSKKDPVEIKTNAKITTSNVSRTTGLQTPRLAGRETMIRFTISV